MATPTEVTFYNAVTAAEGARQSAYAAALTTWLGNYTAANKTTYANAIATAEAAYETAIQAATSTAGAAVAAKTLGDWPIHYPQSGCSGTFP